MEASVNGSPVIGELFEALLSLVQSGIARYLWALGTVPGGEQLMKYTSTGLNAFGTSGPLEVKHGMSVFATVLAWNNAGQELVVYSEGFPVDFTPPTLISGVGVIDGAGPVDLDYQSSDVVQANWSTLVDPESGISTCRWAIGTSPMAADIQGYFVASTVGGQSPIHPSSLPHGTTIYSTVVCTNGAGLSTWVHSDGLTLLSRPPNSTNVTLLTSSTTYTAYDVMQGFVPGNGSILSWTGFVEPAGTPLLYEVSWEENGEGSSGWISLGFAAQVMLSELNLTEGVASLIQVRAVNLAGQASEPALVLLTMLPNPPLLQSSAQISANWTQTTQLHFNWTGVFTSPGPLYYEFSLGENLGTTDVVRWGSSFTDTTATITQPWLTPSSSYFLMLTAYTPAGLYTTVHKFISATNIFG